MSRRFYVTGFGLNFRLSQKGYLKLLQDGAANVGWDLDLPELRCTSNQEASNKLARH